MGLHHNSFYAPPGDQISKHILKVYQVFNDSQTSHTCCILFIYYKQEIWKCSRVRLIFCWPKLGKQCAANSCDINVIAAISVTMKYTKNSLLMVSTLVIVVGTRFPGFVWHSWPDNTLVLTSLLSSPNLYASFTAKYSLHKSRVINRVSCQCWDERRWNGFVTEMSMFTKYFIYLTWPPNSHAAAVISQE